MVSGRTAGTEAGRAGGEDGIRTGYIRKIILPV